MNILAVNSLFNVIPLQNKNKQYKNFSVPNFGIKMQEQLIQDMVSFKAAPAPKLLTNRKDGINRNTANQIYDIIIKKQPEIENFIRGLFAKHLVSEVKPNNLIEYVSGRAKKPGSIVEKSCVLGLTNKNEVFHTLTDLNATKAVILDASRKNVHKTLDILLSKIREGLVILEEVEVKRPYAAKNLKGKDKSKYDYAAPEKINKFVEDAELAMGKKVNFLEPNYTKANYTAIHFLLRLPGQERVFEFQLMGHNVAKFKELDDILFKVLNNKNVDEKYQPIVDILKTISLSKEEKDLLKYAKIKREFKKLSSEEQKLLMNRIMSNLDVVMEGDSPIYKAKIKSLTKSKEFSIDDLSLLVEYAGEAGEIQERRIAELELKSKRNKKFSEYRAKAFLYQREKKYTDSAQYEYFLPLSEDMPAEFDLNNLYKIYLKCNKEAI